jgi:hypothetical protein
MTASLDQEAMFSLTPPPSEFDEVDKHALLTCSPPLTGFVYPSPAPSHSPRPLKALPSDSLSLSHEDLTELPPFDDGPIQLPTSNDMFYSFGGSDTSFLPVSNMPEQDMPPYSSATYPPVSTQGSWMPFSSYPPPSSIPSFDSTSTARYPPFETTMSHNYTNIIPPTPQDIAPASFDFNTMPRSDTHHHLSTSPAFSQQSSHASSLSSLSRSPSPGLYSMSGSGSVVAGRSALRSNSTSSNSSLHAYGIPVQDPSSAQPAWRCAYPGCTSRATFTRGCDLRKHYNRHSKHLFCRVDGCPQSQAASAARSTDGTLSGGFSSKKDRARHEAKHNPGIKCEWKGAHGEECGRIFSRMDNMKDHVRRIHKKSEQKSR